MRRRLKRRRRAFYIPSAGIQGFMARRVKEFARRDGEQIPDCARTSWNLKIGLSVIERLMIDEFEAMG